MDGLQRAAGVGPTIQLGGRTLIVQARFLEHHALISAELAKRRGNPLDVVRQAMSAFEAKGDGYVQAVVTNVMFELAEWRDATLPQIGAWLEATWAGWCFALWLAVRENAPRELTLEEVTRLASREYEDRIRGEGVEAAEQWRAAIDGALNGANGDDELGNSTGSSPGPAEASASNTAKDASPGTTSTAPSPRDTDGPESKSTA